MIQSYSIRTSKLFGRFFVGSMNGSRIELVPSYRYISKDFGPTSTKPKAGVYWLIFVDGKGPSCDSIARCLYSSVVVNDRAGIANNGQWKVESGQFRPSQPLSVASHLKSE